MTMRAVVRRNAATGTDAHGHPVAPSYAAHATIPCRVWSRSRSAIEDGDKAVTVEILRAIFPLDADVREDDQIVNVNNRLGTTLFAGPLDIRTLQRMDNHQAAVLRRPT